MKLKKIIAIGLVGATVLSLSACGKTEIKKDAKSVVKEYQNEIKNVDNMNIKGNVNLGISLKGNGMQLDMPMDLSLDITTNCKDKAKASVKAKVEMFGEKQTTTTDIYAEYSNDNLITYTKDDASSKWDKDTTKIDKSNLTGDYSNLFNNAKFEKTKDGYVITQNLESFAKSDTVKKYLKKEQGLDDKNINEVTKQLKDVNIISTFNKDCKLTSVKIDNTKITTKDIEILEQKMDMTLTVKADLKMTYNKADKSDYTVPESVKKETK